MKIHIVSHTHWDREWYRPFSYFHVKLSYFFDQLFRTLEEDSYKHFMLDGQMVMIEDYLILHPQNKQKIIDLVNQGKLVIGPWYSQPDEFAPDGESLIRNLLIGTSMSTEYGRYMPIGYLPDSFGHTGQLPHILKGANIQSACVMRGVPTHKLDKNEFLWKGTNGDSVKTVALSKGYSNGMFMPKSEAAINMRMAKAVGELSELGDHKHALIMNGVDHQFSQPQVADFIAKSNGKYIHSTLENYVSEIEESDLKTIEGELISPVTNRVHTSIASSRMNQKRMNRDTERMLERQVEPICTLSWLKGAKYPQEIIDDSWKKLLKNQIHDSICGCCTDEVHKDIDRVYHDIKISASTIINMHSRALASSTSKDGLSLLVFNDAMIFGKQLVTGEVFTDSKDFKLLDSQGNEIEYAIENVEMIDAARQSIWSLYLETPCMVYKSKITFYADFDFQCGYKRFEILDGEMSNKKHVTKLIKTNKIENKHSVITFNENGTFDLYDKETKRSFHQLNTLEDVGDAGDTYNYSPVKNDRVITNSDVKNCEVLIQESYFKTIAEISYVMQVPKCLLEGDEFRFEEMIPQKVKTIVTLHKDIKRIDITTKIQNEALDHRIRVLFPTSLKTDHSYAETQFGTIKRPNRIEGSDDWKELGFAEKPLPIYPMQKFVDLYDGELGFAVLNKGLTEYEIYQRDESTIALTLVRGVGQLGKPDLEVRPGRPSGMPHPTPDAQVLGEITSDYSILIHKSSSDEAKIAQHALLFDAPPTIAQNHIKLTNIHKKMGHFLQLFDIERLQDQVSKELKEDGMDYGIIKIDSEELLVSAFKKAQSQDAIILRLYNPTSIPIDSANIYLNESIKSVYFCDFLENNTFEIKHESNNFKTGIIKGYSAQTYKIQINQQGVNQ